MQWFGSSFSEVCYYSDHLPSVCLLLEQNSVLQLFMISFMYMHKLNEEKTLRNSDGRRCNFFGRFYVNGSETSFSFDGKTKAS